jgi:SAM-dependent methyltransferase
MAFRERMKWLLFPGVNLHARLRHAVVPRHLGQPRNGEDRVVLDAGCGNGMLSHQAYLKGNRVVGVSIKSEVARNRELFNKHLGVPEERLCFRHLNLYDIGSVVETFDEIICCEVMEHIKGDRQVCQAFFEILKPGGVLHLCSPNARHPDHIRHPIDQNERDGHVRPGYTFESYQALLEPIGFELEAPIGLGGPLRQACNKLIIRAQHVGGYALGLLAFLGLSPWSVLDGEAPTVPYSVYVKATKPVAE